MGTFPFRYLGILYIIGNLGILTKKKYKKGLRRNYMVGKASCY
jgi:hypothetical protein